MITANFTFTIHSHEINDHHCRKNCRTVWVSGPITSNSDVQQEVHLLLKYPCLCIWQFLWGNREVRLIIDEPSDLVRLFDHRIKMKAIACFIIQISSRTDTFLVEISRPVHGSIHSTWLTANDFCNVDFSLRWPGFTVVAQHPYGR